MLKIGTYSQRQAALYCVSNLFLCFVKILFHFLSPHQTKKSHWFQLQSTLNEAGCLENPLLWLPPCNIMTGLRRVGTMRHLLAHTLREAAMKLGWSTTRTRGGVYVFRVNTRCHNMAVYTALAYMDLNLLNSVS